MILRKRQVLRRRSRQMEYTANFGGQLESASRCDPIEKVQQTRKQRSLGFETIQNMLPVQLVACLVKQVDQVRPVAAVALKDVQLDDKQFLGWQDREILTTQNQLSAAGKPFLIHFRTA